MKIRFYQVTMNRHYDYPAAVPVTESETIVNRIGLSPTVKNVKRFIERHTDLMIDTRWMSVAEQIHDGMSCGYFSINLVTGTEFETCSIGFMEV